MKKVGENYLRSDPAGAQPVMDRPQQGEGLSPQQVDRAVDKKGSVGLRDDVIREVRRPNRGHNGRRIPRIRLLNTCTKLIRVKLT